MVASIRSDLTPSQRNEGRKTFWRLVTRSIAMALAFVVIGLLFGLMIGVVRGLVQ